jgi:hypothetical protein
MRDAQTRRHVEEITKKFLLRHRVTPSPFVTDIELERHEARGMVQRQLKI